MVTLEQVMTRLGQLGFNASESDRNTIQFELDLILDYTVNYCNFSDRTQIPSILDKRIIDRVCCEYLRKQKNAGMLEGFNYDAFVKTIKEGDTQITFGNESDGSTPESPFDALMNYMERGFDKWLAKWRRLKW